MEAANGGGMTGNAHVISVVNHKGGVGKTSTTIGVGWALAEAGQRVLLVDMDPQANLTDWLRIDGTEQSVATSLLYGLERDTPELPEPGLAIQATSLAGLSVLPAPPPSVWSCA